MFNPVNSMNNTKLLPKSDQGAGNEIQYSFAFISLLICLYKDTVACVQDYCTVTRKLCSLNIKLVNCSEEEQLNAILLASYTINTAVMMLSSQRETDTNVPLGSWIVN